MSLKPPHMSLKPPRFQDSIQARLSGDMYYFGNMKLDFWELVDVFSDVDMTRKILQILHRVYGLLFPSEVHFFFLPGIAAPHCLY